MEPLDSNTRSAAGKAASLVTLSVLAILGERAAFAAERRVEYEQDVDLLRLASELIIDGIIEPADLRAEIAMRLSVLVGKSRAQTPKHHGVRPV